MSVDQQHTIMVTTLVSARDQSGRVQVEGPGVNLQLSADEARDLAGNILQAAYAAEADEFLFNWLRTSLKAEQEHGWMLLREFREYREARVARPVEEAPS